VNEIITLYEGEDILEELVTKGAQKLSKVNDTVDSQEDLIELSGYRTSHDFSDFAATFHQASITVSNIVSKLPN